MSIKNEASILSFPSGTYAGVQVCKNGVLRLAKTIKKKPKKRSISKVQENNSNN